MAPSHDLPGLMRGLNLWRPMLRPTYIAAISPIQFNDSANSSQKGLTALNSTPARKEPNIYSTPSTRHAAYGKASDNSRDRNPRVIASNAIKTRNTMEF